jgi:hypothetical protein
MRGLFFGLAALMLVSAPAQSQQSAALKQLLQPPGVWTATWTAGGNSHQAPATFIGQPGDPNKVFAQLPFLAGQVTISECVGLGCSGANLDVSGPGFDCLYNYLPQGQDMFVWTFKGGQNTTGCPPDAQFTRVIAFVDPTKDKLAKRDDDDIVFDNTLRTYSGHVENIDLPGVFKESALKYAGSPFMVGSGAGCTVRRTIDNATITVVSDGANIASSNISIKFHLTAVGSCKVGKYITPVFDCDAKCDANPDPTFCEPSHECGDGKVLKKYWEDPQGSVIVKATGTASAGNVALLSVPILLYGAAGGEADGGTAGLKFNGSLIKQGLRGKVTFYSVDEVGDAAWVKEVEIK